MVPPVTSNKQNTAAAQKNSGASSLANNSNQIGVKSKNEEGGKGGAS